jgi:hypothetical protein
MFSRLSRFARPILVNGAAGVVIAGEDEPHSLLAFTIASGKIVEIDVFGDRRRLRQLNLAPAMTGLSHWIDVRRSVHGRRTHRGDLHLG